MTSVVFLSFHTFCFDSSLRLLLLAYPCHHQPEGQASFGNKGCLRTIKVWKFRLEDARRASESINRIKHRCSNARARGELIR